MADSPSSGVSLLSLFWTPVVAVGCSDATRVNGQISVSTFGASIVPDRPRLLCVLYKANFTHELVVAKGSFALSVLEAGQTELLHALGFRSGRDYDKLAGLDFTLTSKGNPVFKGSLGWLECEVLEAFDLGDATAFLGAVVENQRTGEGEAMLWSQVRRELPDAWLQEWERKIAVDIERSRREMRWV
jgi:flavin reductase (DIM6/NTAB) family NADH-FMN oxidoreductase RutF